MNQLQFHGLKVEYSNSIKGNFIRLPERICQTLDSTPYPIQDFDICIKTPKHTFHLGWDGFTSQKSDQVVMIHPLIGSIYGINNNARVNISISRCDKDSYVSEVHVEPVTSDDWEVIESNSEILQDEILHQTRIVSTGNIIICYVGNIIVKLLVKQILPKTLKTGRIVDGSLIIVEPKENKIRRKEVLNVNETSGKPEVLQQMMLRSVAWKLDDGQTDPMTVWIHPSKIKSQFAFISIIDNLLELGKDDKNEKERESQQIFPAERIAVNVKAIRPGVRRPTTALIPSSMVWNTLLSLIHI